MPSLRVFRPLSIAHLVREAGREEREEGVTGRHPGADLQHGNWIDVDLRANAFLYHMVRNIMGSLILVGKGFRPPEWVQDILLQKDRKLAADTASARGLYLTAVQYPDLITNNET